MSNISLHRYDDLRTVVENADAGAGRAALFGTPEEVRRQKLICAKASAELVANYSPRALLERLERIAQHYEARSELYTSDADLAAAMYAFALGSSQPASKEDK